MRGRIRTIKPEVFQDEKLWDLATETGLPVLQAFAGLWCFADREGRFEWRPRALKPLILPYWEGDFAAVMAALESSRFIVRYVVGGKEYGYVRNFGKHQVINSRESPSELPAPDLAAPEPSVESPPVSVTAADPVHASPRVGHASGTGGARATDLHKGNGKGREWEGNGSGKDARAGVAKTYTMPVQEPPKAYLDVALMGGVGAEQAKSTWTHYWGAGLPPGGVERLHDWLTQRAVERGRQLARLPTPSARHGPNQPNAGKTGLEIFEKPRKAG